MSTPTCLKCHSEKISEIFYGLPGNMEFDSTDKLFTQRCIRHTEFHTNALVQKRNKTSGVPKFIPNVVKHVTVNKVNKEVKEIE